MTRRECPRLWEAEALEDGRLHSLDREAFHRHVRTCAACQRELLEIETLGKAMRALPEPTVTPLEHHRLRYAVLREANRLALSSRRRRAGRWAAALVVLAAAVGVVVAARVTRPRVAPTAQREMPVSAPKFDVESHVGAIWRSSSEGPVTSVEFVEGAASFDVSHLAPNQRFLVSLPDGEIEVRGTRFAVDVRSGRTQSVDVTEGRVLLRRPGEGEIVLLAGDLWPRAIASEEDGGSRKVPAALATRPPSADLASTPPAASTSPGAANAGERFAEAMQAFGAARYTQADAFFAAFRRAFPGDPRSEDAAFLRAVAHSRMDDREGAASLARTYLLQYPRGLRRVEAQRLVDDGER